jgi:pimeloyl-ACP methyl ester carboxylesterase
VTVAFSEATDGFRLAYDRTGDGPPVLLLHGWPGDRGDFRALVPLLDGLDVIVPDLRGFGESDKHPRDPAQAYSAAAQAASVIALTAELGLRGVVVAGYDIGSRIAQTIAADRPGLVRALVIAPPLPGIGQRILVRAGLRAGWRRPGPAGRAVQRAGRVHRLDRLVPVRGRLGGPVTGRAGSRAG